MGFLCWIYSFTRITRKSETSLHYINLHNLCKFHANRFISFWVSGLTECHSIHRLSYNDIHFHTAYKNRNNIRHFIELVTNLEQTCIELCKLSETFVDDAACKLPFSRWITLRKPLIHTCTNCWQITGRRYQRDEWLLVWLFLIAFREV